MIDLVMFIPVSYLAKTFAASKLALERFLRNVSAHMIVQFVKIIENDIAFLELTVIKPVVLSADSNSALFKLVHQKFLVGADESLKSCHSWVKITSINNMDLHLICYSVRVFQDKKEFLCESSFNGLVVIERVIPSARVRLA